MIKQKVRVSSVALDKDFDALRDIEKKEIVFMIAICEGMNKLKEYYENKNIRGYKYFKEMVYWMCKEIGKENSFESLLKGYDDLKESENE